MRANETSESGHAMIAALLISVTLASVAMVYLLTSYRNNDSVKREDALVRARMAADEGLNLAVAELKSGEDADANGLGTLGFAGDDGRNVAVVATDLGGNLYRVNATADLPLASQSAEIIVELVPPASLGSNMRAAITAEGPVVTLGNINVDGRDWDWDASVIRGPGVFGISTVQTITNSGSSTVGGHGLAPAHPPHGNTVEPFANWANGTDEDGDGSIDEELFDGLDDDGDGLVDEDTQDYPTNPDVMLGLPSGTLAAHAIAHGTYFATESALEDYIDANGGNLPGGEIIFADFDTWLPTNLGSDFNDPPSIIVHHNSTGTALMKNLHGAFRGLILADFVEHINGNFILIGALMTFADEMIGNAFGNGSADVYYSSEVLANLPSTSGAANARILSWRRSAAD